VCAAALGATAACSLPEGVDGDLTNGWAPPPRPAQFRPAATGCHDRLEATAPLAEYAPFACTDRHVAETFHVGDLTGPAAAGNADQGKASPALRTATADCSRRADTFVGGPWRTGPLRLQPVLPGADGWAGGARWFRCDIAQIDLGTGDVVGRTGSLGGALAGAAPLKLRCFDTRVEDGRVRSVKAVACGRDHSAEFTGLWNPPAVAFDDLRGDPRMAGGCRSVIAEYTGIPDDGDLRYRVGWLGLAPSRAEWDLGIRAVQCFLWLGGQTMRNSYRDAGPGKLPINYA
jgi:hypothetical protein